MEKQIYLIEGMTCSGCERTVSKIVEQIDGVQEAKADFKASTLSVEYDSNKANIDEIRSAVNRVGYRFVGELPAHGQRESIGKGIP